MFRRLHREPARTDQPSQRGSQEGRRRREEPRGAHHQAAVINQAYQIPNMDNYNLPPPYYETPSYSGSIYTTTPCNPNRSHVYETMDDAGGYALYEKPIFGGGGAVEVFPPKHLQLPYEKSMGDDFPLQFVDKRASRNLYTQQDDQTLYDNEHQYERPFDEEPEYLGRDGLHTQFVHRMSQGSSINQQGQRSNQSKPAAHSADHTLEDVTKDQSES